MQDKEYIDSINSALKLSARAIDQSNRVAEEAMRSRTNDMKIFLVIVIALVVSSFLSSLYQIFMIYGYEHEYNSVNQINQNNTIERSDP